MHVLVVPSWYPTTRNPYNGSFFREQAEGLAKTGHEVGVLALRRVPLYPTRQLHTLRPGVTLSDESGVHVARADVVEPPARLGAVHTRVLRRRIEQLADRYVETHGRPDVLHAHSIFPGGVLARRLSAGLGVPYTITEHRPSTVMVQRAPTQHRLALETVRDAGTRVAVSEGLARAAEEFFAGMGPWETCPNLLGPDFRAWSLTAPRPRPPFVFVHVSHLDEGKKVDVLIDCVAEAFPDDPDVHLRVIGGLPADIAPLRARADAAGLGDRVTFTGQVGRSDLPAAMSAGHVLVLTSREETFGAVLTEALSLGMPCLSTRTWAAEENIRDGDGIIVDNHDEAALVAGLRRARDEYSEAGRQARRERVLARVGLEGFVARQTAIYEESIRAGYVGNRR